MVVRVATGINKGKLWITGTGPTNGCWIGTYEADHTVALLNLVRPGMIAYDVGANAGYYTLALSSLVGDTGHVYSFEPEARNADALRRHIQLNRLRNVTLVQVAANDRSGMVGFQGTSATGSISSHDEYKVPCISLDEFVAAGNPSPSFIKMDIEGAERAALVGSASILSRGDVTWLMATHSEKLRNQCRALMVDYGYRFGGLDGRGDPGEAADFVAIPRRS
jgi:FkbM family methyltransferase